MSTTEPNSRDRIGSGAARALTVLAVLMAVLPVYGTAVARAAQDRTGQLLLELFDYHTRRDTAAEVKITGKGRVYGPESRDADGWFPVRGRTDLSLPPGEYRLRVDGGPRRRPYDRQLIIHPGRITRRSVYVEMPEQLFFEKQGWALLDPLVSFPVDDQAKVATLAEARGLAAVGLRDLAAGGGVLLGNRMPGFGWKFSSDLRYGSTGSFFLPGRRPVFTAYLDCGRPRSFNPWVSAVPWDTSLGRFYDMLPSRPRACRGIAPRLYYELLAGAARGFELDGSESSLRIWMALLKQGYRLPAIAGSRGAGRKAPCMMVRLPAEIKNPEALPAGLLDSLAAGRSVVSFGPFCLISIDGEGPGAVLQAEERERRIRILAMSSTRPRAELESVVLYRDGVELRRLEVPSGRTGFNFDLRIRQDEPAWFAARCIERVRRSGPEGGYDRALRSWAVTNPVRIESRAYSTEPEPVVTRLELRVVSARSGRLLPGARMSDSLIAAGGRPRFELQSPDGVFGAPVPADSVLRISAPGYKPVEVDLLARAGLEGFARRCAAMEPAELEKYLSSPQTMSLLRARLSRQKVTVELQELDSGAG